MRFRKASRRLAEETKRIIRLHKFLRYDCGLEFADKLSARDFKNLLRALKTK